MRYFTFLSLLFCSFFLSAQDECLRVAKVDIIPYNLAPNCAFNPDTVRSSLQMQVGVVFSQNDFDLDLKKLAQEYDKVEPSCQIINNEVFITLKVWLKPQIHAISFVGNERVSSDKLEKELDLKCGTLFERGAFLTQLNKVKQFYLKKGYFDAEICYELVPLSGGSEVDVIIRINEGVAGRIREIRFVGATPGEECELRALLMTKIYQKYFSCFTGSGFYHPEIIERDRLVMLDYYQNRGFADVNICITMEEIRGANNLALIVTVDKGAFYTVGSISFEGNTLFDNEAIIDQFEFCEGEYFSSANVRSSVKAIRSLYGASGYIDTNIDVQLILNPDSPMYDVHLVIDEGDQYLVGMIRVFGNTCTKTKVILNESLLCPGEIFDTRKLEGTEARLLNTTYFSEVNAYAVAATDDESCYRDVYIEVEETDTGNLSLFAGANSLDSIFGGVDICERNFNITGIADLVPCGPRALRGGGEYLHMKANIGQKQSVYLLQWSQPYFLDTDWNVGFDVEKNNNRLISSGYELKTYGGNVRGIYTYNPFVKYELHYRGMHTKTEMRGPQPQQAIQQGQIGGFVSALGGAAIYDSTNNPRRPNCGLRSRLTYEIAGIGGNFDFMKFAYLNSYYYPITKEGTYKFRADVQFIHTYGSTGPDTLPLSEKLFMGGESTVRGYKNFIIGPKFTGTNEPSGGVSSYLISNEYQHNIFKNPCVDGFVFADAGYVSDTEFTVGRPAASLGFGVRFELMRGIPITMGLGFPIHPVEERFNGVEIVPVRLNHNFFFSVGGCF